jgi:polyhydroxyalkanoate synthesis repressor PhaR
VDPSEGPPSEPARLSGESRVSGESTASGDSSSAVASEYAGDVPSNEDHPFDLDAPNGDETRRTIKRYSNRKLYDTRQSRYVTLLQIAEMVRAGEDVQIIDNATKEDKTDVTLALIISEELKARPRAIPLATLKALIRHRGGKLLTQLRESPIGRLMPRDDGTTDHEPATDQLTVASSNAAPSNAEDSHVSKEQPGGLRRTLEQWQHTIDDRIRAVVPHFSTIQELQGEVQQLSKRLEELEKRLAGPRE